MNRVMVLHVSNDLIEEVLAEDLEKEVKRHPKTHRPIDGRFIRAVLQNNGIHAHLVGSLAMGEESKHDIDILITRTKGKPNYRTLLKILKPEKFALTDNPSLYLHDTKFGFDVDIFFEDEYQ